jgi:ArsR family transcriptional regulator, arsenate/arsenite/antimonite-responsive transcriptional repressor
MATSKSVTITTACCAPVGSVDFDEADAAELAKGFAALADPVRLHLLSLVAAGGASGACVCDLVEPSGRSQPTVSHHLKVLREAGLVTSEKRGTWAWYHVVTDRLHELRAALA